MGARDRAINTPSEFAHAMPGLVVQLDKATADVTAVEKRAASIEGDIPAIEHRPPGATDDVTRGHAVGRLWINVDDPQKQIYKCRRNNAGKAQWFPDPPYIVRSFDPTNRDDGRRGFRSGDRILNEETDSEWFYSGKKWCCTTGLDRDAFRFREPSTISVVAAVDGIWTVDWPGEIIRLRVSLGDTGTTSGFNDFDLNRTRGAVVTSIFTDQTKRPQIIYNHATGKVAITDFGVGALLKFLPDDELTLDVDAVAGGTPGKLTAQLDVRYFGKH